MRFKTLQQSLFLGLLAFISIAFLWVVNDYIMPIFWAIVLGIIFIPIHNKLHSYFKFPALTSVVTLLLIVLIIFVPLVFVGSLVVKESVSVYQQISATTSEGETVAVDLIDKFAESATYLERFGVSQEVAKEKLSPMRVLLPAG